MNLEIAREALKDYFGYDSFRPMQEQVIQSIYDKKDTLVIMPTGGGKSMCFQIPAITQPGVCVVISPLIALMKDQVEALRSNGIDATYINSSQSFQEQAAIETDLLAGKIKLLYVSPEKLLSQSFLPLLKRLPMNLIAIDEAHCISEWGHDFRPEYTKMSFLKKQFPKTPVVALTATADKTTRKDIIKQLQFQDPTVFIASFDRPNLSLKVLPARKRIEHIISFINRRPNDSGIVYCTSRKNTESVAQKLKANNIKAAAYHAGLSTKERSRIQEDFINDRTPIICATIAFGMGIDKSNVRWVIHYNLPKNLEGYYQEIGRSGRDSLPSHTLLFYSYADVVQLRKFIADSENATVQYAKLERMQQYAEALSCRRIALLNYFGEHVTEGCGNCDICKAPPKYFDATVLTQKICSAVVRMQEQESMGMLIDVLRGAQNAQVFEKGLQNIKTYGAVKDVSWQDLQQYVIQLLNQGVLEINFRENSRIALTPLAKEILYKKKPVQLAILNQVEKQTEKKTRTRSEKKGLFEKLRVLRYQIAKEQGVPAYVVFGDASLKDMEAKQPSTLSEFAEISGVGEAKLEKYADVFLKEIMAHTESTKPKTPTHEQTWDLFKEGLSPLEIAQKRELTENTIYSHLLKMHAQGQEIDLYELVTIEELSKIEKAKIDLPEAEGLKAYFEYFEEKVPYWKIKIGLYLLDA